MNAGQAGESRVEVDRILEIYNVGRGQESVDAGLVGEQAGYVTVQASREAVWAIVKGVRRKSIEVVGDFEGTEMELHVLEWARLHAAATCPRGKERSAHLDRLLVRVVFAVPGERGCAAVE